MGSVVATGQVTIIDYNDGMPISWSIGATQPKVQRVQQAGGTPKYTPDYTSTNQVLTATFFKQNNTALTGGTYQWQKLSSGTWTNATEGGNTTNVLTISTNLTASTTYRCVLSYTDSVYGAMTVYDAEISLGSIPEGSTTPWAVIISEDGRDTFTSSDTSSSYITLVGKVYANSAEDVVSNYFKWYYWDAGAWNLVDSTHTLSSTLSDGAGTTTNLSGTNVNATKLRVQPGAVPNLRQFKVTINAEGADATPWYDAYFDVFDKSDQWQISVRCTNPVYKNGETGTKTITAYVSCDGTQITTLAGLTNRGATLKWLAYDGSGTAVTTLNGVTLSTIPNGTFTINCLDTDVSSKATVWATIEV